MSRAIPRVVVETVDETELQSERQKDEASKFRTNYTNVSLNYKQYHGIIIRTASE